MCNIDNYQWTKIHDYAQHLGLTLVKAPAGIVVFNNHELFVIRVAPDDMVLSMYHQNYMFTASRKYVPQKLPEWEKINKKVLRECFHKQTLPQKPSVFGVLTYIKKHGTMYKQNRTQYKNKQAQVLEAIARGETTFFGNEKGDTHGKRV